MAKNKKDHVNDLVKIAFRIDEKAALQDKKTADMVRMASLARQGLKDTPEFKELEGMFASPTVVDFGGVIGDLRKVVERLRKYKWND